MNEIAFLGASTRSKLVELINSRSVDMTSHLEDSFTGTELGSGRSDELYIKERTATIVINDALTRENCTLIDLIHCHI
jgi:hypothetical protein